MDLVRQVQDLFASLNHRAEQLLFHPCVFLMDLVRQVQDLFASLRNVLLIELTWAGKTALEMFLCSRDEQRLQ